MAAFPQLADLARTDRMCARLWEGLGYYRRARHMHGAAKSSLPSTAATSARTKPRHAARHRSLRIGRFASLMPGCILERTASGEPGACAERPVVQSTPWLWQAAATLAAAIGRLQSGLDGTGAHGLQTGPDCSRVRCQGVPGQAAWYSVKSATARRPKTQIAEAAVVVWKKETPCGAKEGARTLGEYVGVSARRRRAQRSSKQRRGALGRMTNWTRDWRRGYLPSSIRSHTIK